MLVVRTEIAINQLKELDAVLTLRAKAAIVGRYQEDLQQYPSIEVLWKDIPETYKVYTGPDKVKPCIKLISNQCALGIIQPIPLSGEPLLKKAEMNLFPHVVHIPQFD